ncbi:MAG: invasion associated locus B family protein [Rhizobiales bacterium]|nr:invasion associated locus B family protein [Hyphomicrobiales bacterium]NRB14762.1 invasion associated locus B family protein [Hyphomicrobiales bacterium]
MFSKFIKNAKSVAVIGALVLGASVGISAEAAEDTKPLHWLKKCITNKDSIRTCMITEAIILENNATKVKIQLASVRIQTISNSKRMTMFIQVPNKILLQSGLRFQVDSGTTRVTPFTICFDKVCEAQVNLTEEFVTTMKKGNFVTLNFLRFDGQPLKFQIPLAGFTAGFNSKGAELTDAQKASLAPTPAVASEPKPLPDSQ